MTDTLTETRPPAPRRRRTRRRRVLRVLIWLAAGAVTIVIAAALAGAWVLHDVATDTVGDVRFDQRLKIPPLAQPRIAPDGTKVFDLRLQRGRSELVPGTTTETWGANGAYLGPTLRANRGDRVAVNVANDLPETTSMHWHGMHLPAAADGGPHQPIAPGTTWSPSWRIDQPAATLWYHPHLDGHTAAHVYRGISGLFLLDDPREAALGLPSRYGVDDLPLIVQDKRFSDGGQLNESDRPFSAVGLLGDHVLVNGTSNPYVDVADRRVRLRLLNASNARVYNFTFDDHRAFDLVATDGGLLRAPDHTNHVQLSPGERAEIVVTFAPGERTVLRSEAPVLGANFIEGRLNGGDDRFDVLEIRAADRLADGPEVPARLSAEPPLREADATRTRHFDLEGGDAINGQSMDMSRVDQVVKVDTTEIWEVRNAGGRPHSFHVHDVQFTVLDVAGVPPPPSLGGPKDTVYVPPGQTVRLIMRFSDYTDPARPYMFHCHILGHEDAGMMGQFTVVRG